MNNCYDLKIFQTKFHSKNYQIAPEPTPLPIGECLVHTKDVNGDTYVWFIFIGVLHTDSLASGDLITVT